MSTSIKVGLWNVEWATRESVRGNEIRRLLNEAELDIVCLTEAYCGFLDGGHQIEAEADYGYAAKEGRRKVLLWSRWQWLSSDRHGSDALPTGRYVSGTNLTPIGRIHVAGVCVPWRNAHVSSGRRDRAPWQDHQAYLAGLGELLSGLSGQAIVLGDFNQTMPRSRQPSSVAEALSLAIGPSLVVATRGQTDVEGASAIDHLTHTHDLNAKVTDILPAKTPQGLRLSDHFGFVLDVSNRTN